MKELYADLKEILVDMEVVIIDTIVEYIKSMKSIKSLGLNLPKEEVWALFVKLVEAPWMGADDFRELKSVFDEKWNEY